jgi:hypothetical protein
VIDAELCRVKAFTSRGDSRRPRARQCHRVYAVRIDRDRVSRTAQGATGFITDRDDFLHLWTAFKERGVGDDEVNASGERRPTTTPPGHPDYRIQSTRTATRIV